VLSASEILDWLAFCDVDDFTSARDDLRMAVASCWNRGVPFEKVGIQFPHSSESAVLGDEDLDAHLAEIEEANRQLAEQEKLNGTT
jgi:hypothetical protein